MSQTVDLLSLLARKLESRREVGIPEISTKYRASGLSRMCPREEFFRYRDRVPKFEVIGAGLQRTFDFGTAVHEFVQNHWFSEWLVGIWQCAGCNEFHGGRRPQSCRCGFSVFRYQEISLENEWVTGHPDGVLQFGDRLILLEVKTCSSKQFELITKIRRKPLDAHVDQCQVYMDMLGISEAVIFYIQKDESLLEVFFVSKDEDLARGLLGKVSQFREAVSSGIAPERLMCETQSCARAKACSVKKTCFGG